MSFVILVHGLAALISPACFRRWGRTSFYGLAVVPAVSFIWLCTTAPGVFGGHDVTESFPWIPQLGISLTFRLDPLSWILSAMILGIGAPILFYCASYFKHTNQYSGAFGAQLVLFAGVMFGLVTADDMIVMFVFWEVTSILSYLLIGFAHVRFFARRAALQALIVTTAGGLAMFIGVIMLGIASDSYLLSDVVARAPQTINAPGGGVAVGAALVLILVGALSKSALFPLHFWLPGAMAAPTPVSAFLHAAAMVKAGIYLVARLAPGFADVAPWTGLVVVVGLFTMLFGGYQALKQFDLKLILAYGTVSQLGFIMTVVAIGSPGAIYTGLAMMVAHSLFKSVLFLATGIIDHQAGTREITRLSGIWRKAPGLFVMAILSAASMAGLPPLAGFVTKEGILELGVEGLSHGLGTLNTTESAVVLVCIALGSVLTLAYSARFIWGAFATKKAGDAHPDLIQGGSVHATDFHVIPFNFALAPGLITVLTVAFGLFPEPLHAMVYDYARSGGHLEQHLALWHGITPALGLSLVIIALGFGLFALRVPIQRFQLALPSLPTADTVYRAVIGAIDYLAVRITGYTQRGSLSFYLAVILVTAVVVPTIGLFIVETPPLNSFVWSDSPAQWAIATVMVGASLVAVRANKRFLAILMVSVTGYGLALIFALRGAPDLALTQLLVETISLIAFVLALRMLPSGMGQRKTTRKPIRIAIAAGFGLFMMALAAFSISSRTEAPISVDMPQLAYEIGHGKNVVNVTLVDMRAWDTYGEISVLALAATGVASLIFIAGRQDGGGNNPDLDTGRIKAVTKRYAGRTGLSPGVRVAGRFMNVKRDPFLVAGRTLAPENRSLMLEVITRLLFHTIMLTSVYLLLAGHNLPGGGFSGGLLAGLALGLRYLAGGRYELEEATPLNAGVLLGSGMIIAALYALLPLAWGGTVFTSYNVNLDLWLFGEVHFVTSTIFDVGVYLVVIGLVLDVLRSLGGRIDSVLEEEREKEREKARITGRKRRRIKVRRSGGPQTSVIPSGPVTATSEEEPVHESSSRGKAQTASESSTNSGEGAQ
ncbi:Na+/H+ antiporter subunit A [Kocuria sp. TGY1127_2]|uniref:Na+/H+ antiporter subunit A n=1 Tax=Kocuria sp. TGY1127_2 TaxID=2711328 RepID=UPI0015BD97B2|nr:Na+/H+ antiporter subunit A [Kocuria sp. TGY1127_2]